MTSINWDLCPEATHFTPKLDDSGMFVDVFWQMVGDKAVRAWPVNNPEPLNRIELPTTPHDGMARMIPRPPTEQVAADISDKRADAIRELTNLLLANPDNNEYFTARLIIDAGYSKKESP